MENREINGIPWESLKFETYRLVSFVRYPPFSSLSTIILAKKGFAFLDKECMIICCFCGTMFDIQKNEEIDTLHRMVDCPMIKGAGCINISMDNQLQQKEETLFTRFPDLRESPEISDDGLPEAHTPDNNNDDDDNDNARSSQPYDENGASIIVTTTTDLDEDGPMTQNANSTSIADNSPHVFDEPDSMSTPPPRNTTIPSPDGSSNTQQTNTRQRNTQQNNTGQNNTGQNNTRQNNTQQNNTGQNNTQQNNTGQNNTQQNNTGQNNTQQNNTGQDSADSNSNQSSGEVEKFERLGIITARPKRPAFASLEVRMESYGPWPKTHHLKPKDVAVAGFFYTGYSDCTRCFYCGGGVRNWEEQDDVWVEHARWFPKCAFVFQEVGQHFIDTVLEINKEKKEISYNDVKLRMIEKNIPMPSKFSLFLPILEVKEKEFEQDAAVRSLVDNGFDKDVVMELVLELNKQGLPLSSDKLYEAAKKRNLKIKEVVRHLPGDESVSLRKTTNPIRDKELMERLHQDIGELRGRTQCRLCLDAPMSAMFLPCGHFSTCTPCSHALTTCPICRVGIKAVVKASIP